MSMSMNRYNIFEVESSYQQGGGDDDLEGRFFSDAPSNRSEMMGCENNEDDLLADKFLSLASSSSNTKHNKKFHPSTNNDFLIHDDFEWKVNQIYFTPVVSFTPQNETFEPFEKKNQKKKTAASDIIQDALDLVELDDELLELDDDFSNFTFEEEPHQNKTFAAATSSYCQEEATNTNTAIDDDLGQNYQDESSDDDDSMTMMNVDGSPSLDDSFQRLTKCMELTSQTREMIKKSGLSYASTSALTTPAHSFATCNRLHHSTPNLHPLNKTYDSLERRWSHSPQRSLETRKYKSNIALSNTGAAFQHHSNNIRSSPPCDSNNRRFSTYESIEKERQHRLVDSSSVKRSGVAPRRFPTTMNRNGSFPTTTTKCSAPQNVRLSLATRKQLLTDLRRRKAACMRLNRN